MEGPSIHLLAQELQPFVGQKVKKVAGNAKFDKQELLHQKIKEIYAFGKRLIIQFEHYALATHFLMYGSYRIDQDRPGMAPRLRLITTKQKLNFYNCSIHCKKAADLKRIVPFEYDILSPVWNLKKVVAAVKKHPTASIDDILLDQTIFAGVGNIIKNEVLYLSKVSPLRKVSTLSNKKIVEIALNARLFSEKFLELRQTFELKKNLSIYRKKECPSCAASIVRKKTGKRQRWSFYCLRCQK